MKETKKFGGFVLLTVYKLTITVSNKVKSLIIFYVDIIDINAYIYASKFIRNEWQL